MKNLFNYVIVILIFSFLTSCTDDDSVAPTLNITEPTGVITVQVGGSFVISGSAIDDVEMSVLNIISSDLGLDQSEMFPESMGGSFEITVDIDEETSFGDYVIDIEAIDAAGNIDAAEVKLTVLP